jgi:hypothetical protein
MATLTRKGAIMTKSTTSGRQRTFPRLSLLGALALASTACGSTYRATLTGLTPIPDDSSFSVDGGHLHSGIAVAFTPSVSETSSSGTNADTDPIAVVTSNPAVLQLASVPSDGNLDADSWIVWAVTPGTAVITISAGSAIAANIPIVVTDPPE